MEVVVAIGVLAQKFGITYHYICVTVNSLTKEFYWFENLPICLNIALLKSASEPLLRARYTKTFDCLIEMVRCCIIPLNISSKFRTPFNNYYITNTGNPL